MAKLSHDVRGYRAPSYWLIPSEYRDFCWFGSQNINLSSVYQKKKNHQEWEDGGLNYLAFPIASISSNITCFWASFFVLWTCDHNKNKLGLCN